MKILKRIFNPIDTLREPTRIEIDKAMAFKAAMPAYADDSIKPILATEGWLSRKSQDRVLDIMEPEGWREYLPEFLKYPAFMLNHEWQQILLGIWTQLDIRDEGLYGSNVIYGTKLGSDISLLVRAGVYRAYSVGFDPVEYNRIEGGGYHYIKQKLIEGSLVGVPAHIDATVVNVTPLSPEKIMEEADKKGIVIKHFHNQFDGNRGAVKEFHIMDPEIIKGQIASDVGEAIKPIDLKVADVQKSHDALAKVVSEVKQALASSGKTQSEIAVLIDNVKGDFKKALEERDNQISELRKRHTQPVAMSYAPERLKSIMSLEPLQIKATFGSHADNLQQLQLKMDEINWLDQYKWGQSMMKGGDYHSRPRAERLKSLSVWPEYDSLLKSMYTTSAGYGQEWINPGWSGRLLELVRYGQRLGTLFEQVPMVNKTLTIPTEGADTYAELAPEAAAVPSALMQREQNIATGNITLTAQKFRGRYFISGEETEDAIIALLPHAQGKMSRSVARAIDSAIMNGNYSGTDANLDSGTTMTVTYDRRLAWYGIRYLWFRTLNSGTAGTYGGVDGATFGMDKLGLVRASMGKYGVNQGQLVWIFSLAGYLRRLLNKDEMGEIYTLDKYGPGAINLTGEVMKIHQVPVIVTEEIADNMNASGIYDGTTTDRTAGYLVRRDMFSQGNRRDVEILTERDVYNYGYDVIAYARHAFAPHATIASTNVFIGSIYNVDAVN